MKILILFLDMFRSDELNTYNKHKSLTPFDEYLISLGGRSFINTFTPTPDTRRSLATFLSGEPSYLNNLFKRGSSIDYLERSTFIDELSTLGYSIRILPYPNREELFPKKYRNSNFMISGDNIFHKLNKITSLEENSLTFIDLPDAHIFVNDNLSHPISIKKYHEFIPSMLTKLDEVLEFDSFDLLAIFSDHGHHTLFEGLNFKMNDLLDFRRTKILMHLKYKDENELSTHEELHSISDFFGTILSAVDVEHPVSNQFGNSLLIPGQSRKFVIFEDMYEFYLGINQTPEVWKCVTKEGSYQINHQEEVELLGNWQEAKDILFREHPKILQIIQEYAHFRSLAKLTSLGIYRLHSDGTPRKRKKYKLLQFSLRVYSKLNINNKNLIKKIIRLFT